MSFNVQGMLKEQFSHSSSSLHDGCWTQQTPYVGASLNNKVQLKYSISYHFTFSALKLNLNYFIYFIYYLFWIIL